MFRKVDEGSALPLNRGFNPRFLKSAANVALLALLIILGQTIESSAQAWTCETRTYQVEAVTG